MPQVICTLPNAANKINGYVFENHADGKISQDLPVEVADRFLKITGYKLADTKAQEPDEPPKAPVTPPIEEPVAPPVVAVEPVTPVEPVVAVEPAKAKGGK